jgi:general secretion pathway protein C
MDYLHKFLPKLESAWPFAAGLALAWFLASLAMTGAHRHSAPPSFAPAAVDDSPSRVVLERNVLGLENPLPKTGAGPEPASWKLLGVFSGQRPMALLLIEGKSKAIKVGDQVTGWVLESVSATSAIFRNGSQERVLNIFKEAPPANLAAGTKNKVSLEKTEITPILKDPGVLLQQALFKPALEGGKTVGYRIDNVQDNSILKRIGIQNNDIIVRINGEQIDGPAKMMQLFSGLQSAQAVNMDIKRKGELLSLVIELN